MFASYGMKSETRNREHCPADVLEGDAWNSLRRKRPNADCWALLGVVVAGGAICDAPDCRCLVVALEVRVLATEGREVRAGVDPAGSAITGKLAAFDARPRRGGG